MTLLTHTHAALPLRLASAVGVRARCFAGLALLTIGVLAGTGCGIPDITSGLGIPAGETFLLGGQQEGSYRARVKNHGETSVTLLTSTDGGPLFPVAELAPGEADELRMGPGSPLYLRNESDDQDASLKVEVFGESNLGMSYIANDSM
ncbi:MAG: hypothetical protein AAF235_02940 [Planctomycetota bacterium]